VLGKLTLQGCDIDDCLSCVAGLLTLIFSTLKSEENRVRVVSEVNDNAPPRLFFLGSAFTTELLKESVLIALKMISDCECDKGCFECILSRYESVSVKLHVLQVLNVLHSAQELSIQSSQDLTLDSNL
jgi:hypothetical protein